MLLPGIGSRQNLAAGRRQLRQGYRLPRLCRLFRRLRVEDRILEPVGEVGGAAAVAAFLRLLALAVGGSGWAGHPDVKVVIVAVPRTDLGEPAAVAFGFAARCILDRGVDETPMQ